MFRTQFEIFEIIIGASESIENRVSTKEDEKIWSDAILCFVRTTRICFDSRIECLTFVLLSCTSDSDYAYLV